MARGDQRNVCPSPEEALPGGHLMVSVARRGIHRNAACDQVAAAISTLYERATGGMLANFDNTGGPHPEYHIERKHLAFLEL